MNSLKKEENSDKVIATCKATIWKFTAQKIVLKFERESGIELSHDLNVLIKANARFDPHYGFSVIIEDIDSSFTLGDIARRYQQIVERLTLEGLIDKNKQLPTPFDIHNVLVITPENAAGLGDFKRDADILEKTGVCHFVYHTATDTPSKVIAGIRSVIVERSQQSTDFLHSIKLLSQHQITTYQSQNEQLMKIIKTLAQAQINTASTSLVQINEQTQYLANRQIKQASKQIEVLFRETLLQNPKQVMSKGYAVLRCDAKAIRSVQQFNHRIFQLKCRMV